MKGMSDQPKNIACECGKEGECPLDTLGIGVSGKVKRILCSSNELRRKLFSLGIVQGANISVSSVAPLGDPITINVKGSQVALRRSEASPVLVDPSLVLVE